MHYTWANIGAIYPNSSSVGAVGFESGKLHAKLEARDRNKVLKLPRE